VDEDDREFETVIQALAQRWYSCQDYYRDEKGFIVVVDEAGRNVGCIDNDTFEDIVNTYVDERGNDRVKELY